MRFIGNSECGAQEAIVTDTTLTYWPRDLDALNSPSGTLHTFQRGLRTAIAFGATNLPVPFTVFYLQNFSALTDYFSRAGAWGDPGRSSPPTSPTVSCVASRA